MSGYTVRPERNVRRSLPGAQAVYNKTGCLNMRTACFLTLQEGGPAVKRKKFRERCAAGWGLRRKENTAGYFMTFMGNCVL